MLHVDVLGLHSERGADAGEAVDHQCDQRPIAQARRCRDVDAVEQLPRLGGIEHRRLALAHDMRRPAHGRGRINRHHLAGHQPVEQVADGGELLLDRGRGNLARLRFDPGRDMQRLHGYERWHAMHLAPGQKLGHGTAVGPAGVLVADRRGEELEETPLRLIAGRGDERRQALECRNRSGQS